MITEKRSGELVYLAADRILVPHAFTTRFGGVSTGYLSSLNLGFSRGDDPKNVYENYRRLGQALNFRPEDTVLSHQTHSDIVQCVGDQDRGVGIILPAQGPCDALITNTPGIALTIFTADCTPILLWDPVTGAVGAIHAGWRGTAKKIAAKTVAAMTEAFGSRPEDIRAAIGPNIGQCHFETDRDVPEALTEAIGEAAQSMITERGGKYYPDLKAVNRYILEQAGVGSVEVSTACTVCSCDRFWSHRVTGNARGSQAGVIVCGGTVQ